MNEHTTLKAVIFDIDGTIIDTELVQSEAYLHVLKEHGVNSTELTEHGTIHTPGEPTADTWERLINKHRLTTSIDELSNRKRQATLDALEGELEPMPGFPKLVDELQSHNIKLALATSAKTERAQHIVNGLGLVGIFGAIVSANDVDNVKPSPDPYLVAAKMLDVSPAECAVIEDSYAGIASGNSAGMKTIAVPNSYTRSMDFSDATLCVQSLEELDFDKISSLFS